MAETTAQKSPRMSTGLRVIFCLSLALNLLIVGALAGTWIRNGFPDRELTARAAIGRILYAELPRSDQRAMRQVLKQAVDKSILRQARIGGDLDRLLRAEPFDSNAVRALLDRQAYALTTGQNAMRDAWVDLLSTMPEQERLDYADRLKSALSSRRPPRHKDLP